ncbi:hypothetical protein M422DRAFT_47918 [Sphaerobolus stellatus SS14]|uniref:Uncharacterized protein n=1 Tax=Sphaerobolus stellatus (strain SS14) TaxID=990650 RepID=A0A0C9VMV8_SPHS4|nr:hypothetical protein M422DRAFT_47918 [Sphaerobolus stellatus SS14]
MHISPAENDEQLPEEIFPRTPSSCALKRAHFTSPEKNPSSGMHTVYPQNDPSNHDIFMDVDSLFTPQIPTEMKTPNPSPPASLGFSEEPTIAAEANINEIPEPFQGEKVFQLFTRWEFPRAGQAFKKNQETMFHTMKHGVPDGFPYWPYMNEEEWSLAEFLATTRFYKGSIDAFLKTTWVCPV